MNTWPDIMTRWMRGYLRSYTAHKIKKNDLCDGRSQSTESNEFVSPSTAQTLQIQQAHPSLKPARNDKTIWKIERAARIPENCGDLKLRLLTILHAGKAGHREAEAT